MLRTAHTVVRLTPTFIIPFLYSRNEYDTLGSEQKKPETGWERLRQMFTKNDMDEVSIELHNVAQASMCGAFIGAGIGGFVRSKAAYINFIENNQATIFKTPMQAKKKLQDFVTVAFCKGAYEWGWRLGFFTGTFSLIATTISVYNGDTSLVEYVTAGAITGGLYKANLGLAATFVGAGLGAALSTVAGLAILGILKVTGVAMTDIRRALYKIKESREDQLKQAMAKASEFHDDPLTLHHEVILEEKGMKKLEEIQ